MKRKQKPTPTPVSRKAVRTHRKTIVFNDAEIEAISGFCKKYKIQNQAKFFRQTIIAAILRKSEEDHPKLF